MEYGITGIPELDLEILNNMDDDTLLKTCQVNKSINAICFQDRFWLNRFKSRFPNILIPNNENPKDYYFYYAIWNRYGKLLGDFNTILQNKPRAVTPIQYYDWLNKFYEFLSRKDFEISDLYSELSDYPFLILMAEFFDSRYDLDKIDILIITDRYYDVSNGMLISLSDIKDNYLFVQTLRLAGTPNEIRRFLLSLGYDLHQIDRHILNAQQNPARPRHVPKPPDKLPNIFDIVVNQINQQIEDNVNDVIDIILRYSKNFTDDEDKNRFINEVKNRINTM